MPIHFVELAGLWDLMPVYAVVMLEVSKLWKFKLILFCCEAKDH
jgi:hypothetical protein